MMMMILQKYVDEQFLTEGVFITQLYGNVGICLMN